MDNLPQHIADIRTDYALAALDDAAAGDDPITFFQKWFADAEAAQITEVNAMTLATAGADGMPHARIVLLKGMDADGFKFYTNYDSDKGRQIADKNHAALIFFWKELERQVRVEGRVEKVSAADSDAYFHSRPVKSQLGALASPQSRPIQRAQLEESYKQCEEKYAGLLIPRPPYWGGYSVVPARIEFWQGRRSRLHDRIVFIKDEKGGWQRERIAP